MAKKPAPKSKDSTPAVAAPVSIPSHLAGLFGAPQEAPVETGAANYAPRVIHYHPMSPSAPSIMQAAALQGVKNGVETGTPIVQKGQENIILDVSKASFFMLAAAFYEYFALRVPTDAKKTVHGVLTAGENTYQSERDCPDGSAILQGGKWVKSVLGGAIVLPEPGAEPIAVTFRQDKARANGYSVAASTIHRLSKAENQTPEILALAGAGVPAAFRAHFQWGVTSRQVKASGHQYVIVDSLVRYTEPGASPFLEVVEWLGTQDAQDQLTLIQEQCERDRKMLEKQEEETRQKLGL